jgi:hypothetical protein
MVNAGLDLRDAWQAAFILQGGDDHLTWIKDRKGCVLSHKGAITGGNRNV